MKLCIVTGEASGDLHASHVVRELRELDPDLTTFGFGGQRLRDQGMTVLHDVRALAIVGLFNVIRQLPMFLRVHRELMRAIEQERPDAVLLVDYPDFNLRVARACRRLGVPVIYYISPQVWAWRRRRVRRIARDVDHMIVIFPFEEAFYRDAGVPVTYVGHPIVEQMIDLRRERASVPGEPLRVALMPGSRRAEVRDLLPAMLEAVDRLATVREVDVSVLRAPTIDEEEIAIHLGNRDVRITEDRDRSLLASSDLAICSSGTATLEAAVLLVPLIVIYRLSRLTYQVARMIVRLPHFSLVNIVAGRRVVPELLQHEVTPGRIAREALEIVEPKQYRRIVGELREVSEALGERGASGRAADKIATLVRSWRAAKPNEESR